MGEPINETGQYGDGLIIRGKHYVLVESIKQSSLAHRMMAEQIMLSPHLSFDASTTNVSLVSMKYNTMVSEREREGERGREGGRERGGKRGREN